MFKCIIHAIATPFQQWLSVHMGRQTHARFLKKIFGTSKDCLKGSDTGITGSQDAASSSRAVFTKWIDTALVHTAVQKSSDLPRPAPMSTSLLV